MKQTNSLTKKLTAAQEAHAYQLHRAKPIQSNQAVVYRLYTEYVCNLDKLTTRYFKGATIIETMGLWQGEREYGAIIEVIGSAADLQSVVHLAGDIRQVNHQSSVLVTWNNVSLLNVTGDV